jgi:DNA invertase Pin-like site-specific DNA recombinase
MNIYLTCCRKPVRQEVIRLAESGIKKRKIATQLSLGEATIYRILAAKNTG